MISWPGICFWSSIFLSLYCTFKAKSYQGKIINYWDWLFLAISWQIFNFGAWHQYLAYPVIRDYAYNVSAGLLILILLLYVHRRRIKLGIRYSIRDILWIFGSLAGLTALIPIGFYFGLLRSFHPNTDPEYIMYTALGYFLLVAPAEELVFRGIIFNLLEKKWVSRVSLTISTFLFAIIWTHLTHSETYPNWAFVILAGVAGAVYGFSYYKTRNILVPIAIHGAVDTLRRILFN